MLGNGNKTLEKVPKLSLKLRTKLRKSNKLLDKGLLRTCKKLPKSENCSSQLNICRPLGGRHITKAQIIKCMKNGKIEGAYGAGIAGSLQQGPLGTAAVAGIEKLH